MPKSMVLVRHLPHSVPVAYAIVEESTDPAVDDQVHYMESKAKEIENSIIGSFPEFREATFYRYILGDTEKF